MAISQKRCKIGGKLLLTTNRKSHYELSIDKLTKLGDLEQRNRPNGCVISRNSAAFWADCVKVVEDNPILSAEEM